MSTVKNADHQEVLSPVIRLRSGEKINLTNHKKFHLEEMQNLTRIYRFGARINFTVSQHIRLGLLLCDSIEQKKAWVLHEAFESLTTDVASPLKQTWPWYVEQESKYLEFVFNYHKLDYTRYDELVIPIDRLCFQLEEGHFFRGIFSKEIFEVTSSDYLPLTETIKQFFPEIYGID